MANSASVTKIYRQVNESSTRSFPKKSTRNHSKSAANQKPYSPRNPNTDLNNGAKLCVGDYVSLIHKKKKCKGVIKFIGPNSESKLRYGIDLDKAIGDHNGTPPNSRQYFRCRDKHGILIQRKYIVSIQRPILNKRLTVHDKVHVQHRGEGLVRFVGPVERTQGIWFGVELTKRNGRHDGMIRKTRYFKCKLMHGVHARLNTITLIDKRPRSKTYHHSKPNVYNFGREKRNRANSNNKRPDKAPLVQSDSLTELVSHSVKQKVKKIEKAFDPENEKKSGKDSAANPLQKLQERRFAFGGKGRSKTIKVLMGSHISKSTPNRKFLDDYECDELEDELGDGEFGTVYKCKSRSKKIRNRKRLYAVKKIKKSKLHHINESEKRELVKRLREEITLLKDIKKQKRKKLEGYKHIIHFVDVYEDRNYLYIVTNFCSGGDLWTYIESQGVKSERECADIIRQVLKGLLFLSFFNVAHLDLKPANIMFVNEERKRLQIIDFGMSRIIPRLKKMKLIAGTPHFLAPEVIQGSYDVKADMWSVGVILFLLLFGYPPFFDDSGVQSLGNDYIIYEKIQTGFLPVVQDGYGPWFPKENPVSKDVRDLIKKLLQIDLSKRITVQEALDHPWLTGGAVEKKLDHTVHDAFVKFSRECKFRVLVSQIFTYKVSPREKKRVMDVFQQFDQNEDGKISLSEFVEGMKEFNLGYTESQIEEMFHSLDADASNEIDIQELMTSFSYQRLVASDERLYEAFCEIDKDGDGKITKQELVSKINQLKRVDEKSKSKARKLLGEDPIKRNKETKRPTDVKNDLVPSIDTSLIEESIEWADMDSDGEIDYEEWLRALHPVFNEPNTTPKHLANTPTESYTFTFKPTESTMTEKPRYGKDGHSVPGWDDDYESSSEFSTSESDDDEAIGKKPTDFQFSPFG